MENVTIKVSKNEYPKWKEQKAIFNWEIIGENEIDDETLEITMVRDNSVPYYDELVILEKDYFSTPVNWFPIIVVFAGLAIVLLTLFALFKFAFKDVQIPEALLYVFLFSGMGFTVLSLVICFLFSKRTLASAQETEKEKNESFIKKVEELKNGK